MKERLDEFVSRVHDYDVLLLQGVYGMPFFRKPLHHFWTDQSFLLWKLKREGFQHCWVAPRKCLSWGEYLNGGPGLVIASKFPLFDTAAEGWGGSIFCSDGSRGVITAALRLEGSPPLYLINVNLGPVSELPAQLKSLRRFLCETVEGNRIVPGVLAGDFCINALTADGRTSPQYGWMCRGLKPSDSTLTDALLHSMGSHVPTRPQTRRVSATTELQFPPQRTAYVFTHGMDGTETRCSATLERFVSADNLQRHTYLSDHFGIALRVEIEASPTVCTSASAVTSHGTLNYSSTRFPRCPQPSPAALSIWQWRWAIPLVMICAIICIAQRTSLLSSLSVGILIGFAVHHAFWYIHLAPPGQAVPLKFVSESNPQTLDGMMAEANRKLTPRDLCTPKSIAELWKQSVERYKWKPLLRFSSDDNVVTLTYLDVNRMVNAIASALQHVSRRGGAGQNFSGGTTEIEIRKRRFSTVVCFLCDPHPHALLTDLACMISGIPTLHLEDAAAEAVSLGGVIDSYACSTVVASPRHMRRLLDVRSCTLSTIVQLEASPMEKDWAVRSTRLEAAVLPWEALLKGEHVGVTLASFSLSPPLGPADSPEARPTDTWTLLPSEILDEKMGKLDQRWAVHGAMQCVLTGLLQVSTHEGGEEGESHEVVQLRRPSTLIDRVLLLGAILQGRAVAVPTDTYDEKRLKASITTATEEELEELENRVHARTLRRFRLLRYWLSAMAWLRLKLIWNLHRDSSVLRWMMDWRTFKRVIVVSTRRSTERSLLMLASLYIAPSVCEVVSSIRVGLLLVNGRVGPLLRWQLRPLSGHVAIASDDLPKLGELWVAPAASSIVECDECALLSTQLVARNDSCKAEHLYVISSTDALLFAPDGKESGPFRSRGAVVDAGWLERQYLHSCYAILDLFLCEIPLKQKLAPASSPRGEFTSQLVAVIVPRREYLEHRYRMTRWVDIAERGVELFSTLLRSCRDKRTEFHPRWHIQNFILYPHPFFQHQRFTTLTGLRRRDVIERYFFAMASYPLKRDPLPASFSGIFAIDPHSSPEEIQRPSPSLFHDCASTPDLRTVHLAALDIGGTCAKIACFPPPNVELPPCCVHETPPSGLIRLFHARGQQLFPRPPDGSNATPTQLVFLTCPTDALPVLVEHLSTEKILQRYHPSSLALGVPATGGGAAWLHRLLCNAYATTSAPLPTRVLNTGDEWTAVIRGLALLLQFAPEAVVRYDETKQCILPHRLPPTRAERKVPAASLEEALRSGGEAADARSGKAEAAVENASDRLDATGRGASAQEGEKAGDYPIYLCNVGSGVSIVKCEGWGNGLKGLRYTRVGGSAIGGATFWGLAKTLTTLTTWEEVHTIVQDHGPGDHTNVDLLVGDIYGFKAKGLPKELSVSTLASSFGRMGVRYAPLKGGVEDKPRAIDMVHSLLIMICNNVAQLTYLYQQQGRSEAEGSGAHARSAIIFTGGFVRSNPLAMRHITGAMRYWSRGNIDAHFLQCDGYLGALGLLCSDAEI